MGDREAPENLVFVCGGCAPCPDPQFLNMPLAAFVGRHCKLGFPVPQVEGLKRPTVEHMWVKVTAVRMRGEVEVLVGWLDNDPAYVDLRYQDLIEFRPAEVEAVV